MRRRRFVSARQIISLFQLKLTESVVDSCAGQKRVFLAAESSKPGTRNWTSHRFQYSKSSYYSKFLLCGSGVHNVLACMHTLALRHTCGSARAHTLKICMKTRVHSYRRTCKNISSNKHRDFPSRQCPNEHWPGLLFWFLCWLLLRMSRLNCGEAWLWPLRPLHVGSINWTVQGTSRHLCCHRDPPWLQAQDAWHNLTYAPRLSRRFAAYHLSWCKVGSSTAYNSWSNKTCTLSGDKKKCLDLVILCAICTILERGSQVCW